MSEYHEKSSRTYPYVFGDLPSRKFSFLDQNIPYLGGGKPKRLKFFYLPRAILQSWAPLAPSDSGATDSEEKQYTAHRDNDFFHTVLPSAIRSSDLIYSVGAECMTMMFRSFRHSLLMPFCSQRLGDDSRERHNSEPHQNGARNDVPDANHSKYIELGTHIVSCVLIKTPTNDTTLTPIPS